MFILNIIRNISFNEIKNPLGRWHNSGQFYNEKYLKLKETQKKKREIMKKYNIDPFYIFNSKKTNIK